MNKILTYTIIGIIVLFGLYYFLGTNGLLGGLIGVVGFGGSEMRVKRKQEENLDLEKRKKEKLALLKEIEAKQKELELDDLTPEEEREYWKNQK